MAGLVPAISLRRAPCVPHRDGRNKSGHDNERTPAQPNLSGSLAAFGDEPCRVLEVAGLIETLGEVLHDGVLGSAPGLRDAGPLNGRNRLGAGLLGGLLGVAETHAVSNDQLQPMVVQAEVAAALIELGELLIREAEI